MIIDITLNVTPKMQDTASENTARSLVGHMGTHFDVMDKDFPLEYTARDGIIFDVTNVRNRDIEIQDIDLNEVRSDMFVAFYTGFIDNVEYGTQKYFKEHPQLSFALIDALLEKNISIIGVDCAGIRRGKEHVPIDQRCADNNVFVVENLADLRSVLAVSRQFTARTYPVRFSGVTGLPCRVVAEV